MIHAYANFSAAKCKQKQKQKTGSTHHKRRSAASKSRVAKIMVAGRLWDAELVTCVGGALVVALGTIELVVTGDGVWVEVTAAGVTAGAWLV